MAALLDDELELADPVQRGLMHKSLLRERVAGRSRQERPRRRALRADARPPRSGGGMNTLCGC